jgi:uncharacterized protein DUF2786
VGARKKRAVRADRPVVTFDDAMVAAAVRAAHHGPQRDLEAGIDRLVTAPAEMVDTLLSAAGDQVLRALFARGWQPADVVRATDPAHRSWAARMIRRHMRGYPADRIGELWSAQLAVLEADPPPADRHDATRALVEVLGILTYLPDLPVLMPPPGVARARRQNSSGGDGRMLGKIRALLAKAESTSFPGEAEAYSAKAQQLMAQHRIDHALVAGEVTDPDQPVGVRVPIEKPYADAKALLLHVVAEANGCQAVWSSEHGFSTVFGFADELEAVELLYTSLLVQGSAAMVREGSARHDNPARTKTFRQSFMHAYAIRIGDRLRATAAAANSAAAQVTDGLLPVLARRDRAVQDQVDRWFPRLESKARSIRVDSEDGWRSGTAHADRATLDR